MLTLLNREKAEEMDDNRDEKATRRQWQREHHAKATSIPRREKRKQPHKQCAWGRLRARLWQHP